MRTIKVTNGDIVINNGDFVMIDEDEELAQSVRMNIEAAQGEWFLDLNYGMDRESIETKPYNEEAVQLAIIEAATADERIQSVEDLVLTPDFMTRRLSVSMRLIKQTGEEVALEGIEF
ncbi:DUF2634 domain-containing protein [Exiguobacterium sp. R-39]|uniref:DUF2634 domain-containing protein n=1 Tax=Exiguobacterium sp. R-39 TaxID=3416708 RepID=UPI003CF76EA2